MAACRRNVPLRETSMIQVDDGTTCRMPGPIPGPLREDFAIDPDGPSCSLWSGLSSFHSLGGATNMSPVTLAKGKAA